MTMKKPDKDRAIWETIRAEKFAELEQSLKIP